MKTHQSMTNAELAAAIQRTGDQLQTALKRADTLSMRAYHNHLNQLLACEAKRAETKPEE